MMCVDGGCGLQVMAEWGRTTINNIIADTLSFNRMKLQQISKVI